MKSGLAVMIHLIEELGTDSLVGVFYAGEEGPLPAKPRSKPATRWSRGRSSTC
jgi:hypothetical protein